MFYTIQTLTRFFFKIKEKAKKVSIECVHKKIKNKIKHLAKKFFLCAERKKPFRKNGTASNDCLPYEKKFKLK
jgi:hypothetical protein